MKTEHSRALAQVDDGSRRLAWAAVMFVAALLLLTACQSGPRVRTHAAPEAQMQRYGTYGFFEKLGTDEHGYTGIATRYLQTAVARELEARGLRRSEQPDLLVNFYVKTNDRVEATPGTRVGVGYGRGRWGGWGGGWGGSMDVGSRDLRNYKEGTLTIDLVDRAKNEVAWQGIAEGRLTEAALKNVEETVDSAVKAVFAKYPVQVATAQAATPAK